eukprot:4382617-Amphidinium_carterae.1
MCWSILRLDPQPQKVCGKGQSTLGRRFQTCYHIIQHNMTFVPQCLLTPFSEKGDRKRAETGVWSQECAFVAMLSLAVTADKTSTSSCEYPKRSRETKAGSLCENPTPRSDHVAGGKEKERKQMSKQFEVFDSMIHIRDTNCTNAKRVRSMWLDG